MPTPSITVTRQTSIQDLKAFADAATGKERLKGRKNDDGSVTLYQAKHSKPSVWSKITGQDQKSDAAVRKCIKLFHRSIEPDKVNSKAERSLAKLMHEMPRSPTASQLRLVMNLANRYSELGISQSERPQSDQPKLENLLLAPRTELRLATQLLAAQITAGGLDFQGDATIDRLAEIIAAGVRNDPVVSGLYPDALFSDGKSLIAELRDLVLSQVNAPLSQDEKKDLTGMLTTAFNRACNLALGGSTMTADMSEIHVGDTTYVQKELIAKGGYAAVYRYESVDGGESVAVKLPLQSGQVTKRANDALAQEIPAHKVLSDLGSDSIIGMKAALRGDDGTFVVVSELAAPMGDAYKLALNVENMVKNGFLSKQEQIIITLTLAYDMARGLDAMHEAGLSHLDFKPPNVLIGMDGVAKVADFGTATALEGLTARALEEVQNPIWKDAAVLYTQREAYLGWREGQDATLKDEVRSLVETLFPDFEIPEGDTPRQWSSGLPEESKRAVRNILDLGHDLGEQAKNSLDVNGVAADAYSLGVSILNLLRGTANATDRDAGLGLAMIEDMLVDRARDGSDYLGDGALNASLGDPSLDALINALTAPNPEDRPSNLSDFLQRSDAFGLGMVGTPEVRGLIQAIAQGDAASVMENRLQI